MIDNIRIENLRGVRKGELHALAPLTVLVGRNGAGKSTVLEALALGASHQPGEALGRVVSARGGWNGARWVVSRVAQPYEARIMASLGLEERTIRLTYLEATGAGTGAGSIRLDLDRTGLREGESWSPSQSQVDFQLDNEYRFDPVRGLDHAGRVHFVHSAHERHWPMSRSLQAAVETGRLDDVHALLREVLGDEFRDLYPLPEREDGTAVNVHLRFATHSVPVPVAGDGIRNLVRLALELAGRAGSLVLIEEPEVHLHPGAIWLAARAILASVRRGLQLILSTHSLELLDALVELSAEADLDRFQLIRLALADGELRAWSIAGPDVRFMRQDIAEDLR